MKSLIATSILLLSLLACITANFFFINHVTDHMEKMIQSLPTVDSPSCVEASRNIRDYWEQRTDWIGLSVGYNIIDRVCEQSALLASCAKAQDIYGYHSARTLLLDAIGDVRRAERFSIGNLL